MTALTWQAFPYFYLCNLQDVKNFMLGAIESDWDDTELAPFVEQVSADFAGELQRLPLPHNGTFLADYAKGFVDDTSRYLNVYPYADVLSVSSAVNGNGQTIDSSYYVLEDANCYPKSRIAFKASSPIRWRGANNGDYQQVISVTGTFGYVPHYDNAWKAKTTITEPIADTTVSTITLASVAGVNIGDYLQIDSESFLVRSIAALIVTVDRGALGTTAASHLDNASVKLYQQASDIKNAVREWAAYLWKTKDKIGEDIEIYQGTQRVPRGLSPTVINAVLRNRKVQVDGLNGRFN